MCFDDADDDVFAALVPADGLAQHVVGFADAGGVSQKELERAAGLFGGYFFQPLFRAFRGGTGWSAG